MKFETNHFISPDKNYEFQNIDQAKESPLAQQLFHLPFVKQSTSLVILSVLKNTISLDGKTLRTV